MLFSVKETGIGILAHEIHRIFENFHRAHNQEHSFEASGMGLALTQELVNLHDKKLEMKSTFEYDIIFTIYIPIENNHLSQNQLTLIEDNVSR